MLDLTSDAPDELTRAHETLRKAWRDEGGLSIAQRRDVLKTLRQSLLARTDDYVDAISADFRGRSTHETLITEIAVIVSTIDYTLPRIARWAKPSRVPLGLPVWPAKAAILPQPRGVAGIVAPSNYPLQLALMPFISTISAGCRALIKPSELTPRTAELIRRHLTETFAPSIVNVVCGDAQLSDRFVHLPFDVLLFTGSPRVGAKVAMAAATNMTPLILELGGKSPVIVDRSADLARAAESIIAGKLMNAGQTCVAPDYVLVAQEAYDGFAIALKAAAAKLYPGNAARDYSAMLSDRAVARMSEIETGEKIVPLLDGEVTAPRVMPKLLLSPSRESAAMSDEIFGPLLPLLPYRSIDDAIARVRTNEAPLVIYWFGEENADFHKMTAATQSGAVSVNETLLHAGVAALPFGGVGRSGIGRYHGKAGFDAFSNDRVMFKQSRWSLTRLLRPPYGKLADRLLSRLLGRAVQRTGSA